MGEIGGVGFLMSDHYLRLLLRSGHHKTQAVALKHPTWENYTKHSVRAHFLSQCRRTANRFHSWVQCVSLKEPYILHHMRVCCVRLQSDTLCDHKTSTQLPPSILCLVLPLARVKEILLSELQVSQSCTYSLILSRCTWCRWNIQ